MPSLIAYAIAVAYRDIGIVAIAKDPARALGLILAEYSPP